MEHRVRNCPQRSDEVQASTLTPNLGLIQPPWVAQQPPRGRDTIRDGNGSGRGQRAPGRGVG